MPFNLVPTSLLGAVNECLTAIGTVPVNTLDAPGASDVAIATDTIESISREVQSRGWWFNKTHAVQLTPSGSQINVPLEYLSVRPSLGTTNLSPETQVFALRDGRLWNLTTGSYNFTVPVRADIVALLDFDELPESVRRYITIRAARVFQTKVLGDEAQGVYNEAHEMEAHQILEGDEQEQNPHSRLFMQRVRMTGQAMRPNPVSTRPPSRNG